MAELRDRDGNRLMLATADRPELVKADLRADPVAYRKAKEAGKHAANLSKRAAKSGSKEDHQNAQIAHSAAAKKYADAGDGKKVKEHQEKSSGHSAAAKSASDASGGGHHGTGPNGPY